MILLDYDEKTKKKFVNDNTILVFEVAGALLERACIQFFRKRAKKGGKC